MASSSYLLGSLLHKLLHKHWMVICESTGAHKFQKELEKKLIGIKNPDIRNLMKMKTSEETETLLCDNRREWEFSEWVSEWVKGAVDYSLFYTSEDRVAVSYGQKDRGLGLRCGYTWRLISWRFDFVFTL